MPEAYPKFPNAVFEIGDCDGNAFAILGRVRKVMKRAQVDQADIDAYTKEATSGNYDHLLATTYKWVTVSF